jgi:hypothetical protein
MLPTISIIIGVIGALLGVYFRESLRAAHQQKLVALRLNAYLQNLIEEILDSEFEKLFFTGVAWDKDITEAASKGIEAFQEVDEKYKKMLEEVKIKINEGVPEINKTVEKNYKSFREMDEEIFQFYIQQLEKAQNYLIRGVNFISDEDATKLSWIAAHRVIEIKSHAMELITKSVLYMKMLRKMDALDIKALHEVIFDITKHSIMLSRHVTPLFKYTKIISQCGILKLAFQKMMGKA